ncbi:GNAT family N-acetyltransferase [Crossiella equi]|uniref:GNAT family N-acetyltransferase n=1 Tax=Crossiella equi TaxID=130796 RepID=UPI000A3B6EF3|nr:GNAT family N-acetyltransferase [Crossiella equi]
MPTDRGGVTVRTSKKIDVDPAEWAALTYPEHPRSAAYLDLLTRMDIDGELRFFTAERDGKLIAAAYGSSLRFPLWKSISIPLFLAGSPANLGCGFLWADKSEVDNTLPQLTEAMAAEAKSLGAKVLLMRDFWAPGPDAAFAPRFRALGYRRVAQFPDAVLDVPWSDVDGWLASLPSAARKTAKRDARRVETAGFRFEVHRGRPSPELAKAMERLWLNLFHKYRDPDQLLLPAEYFQEVPALPEGVLLLTWHGEDLVCFDMLEERGTLLESTYSGADHERIGSTPVHRFMGHRIIEHAITHGFTQIDFGLSNEEAKVKMGCTLRTAWGYSLPLTRTARLLRLDRVVFPDQ